LRLAAHLLELILDLLELLDGEYKGAVDLLVLAAVGIGLGLLPLVCRRRHREARLLLRLHALGLSPLSLLSWRACAGRGGKGGGAGEEAGGPRELYYRVRR
jgi:hypothetical protein